MQNLSRTEQAALAYHTILVPILQQKEIDTIPNFLFLRAFKKEQQLELWASNSKQLQLIATYKFTAFSGKLGPKHKEGDKQIPEGFYEIDLFNPASQFFLSMRVNYPNKRDKIVNANEAKIGSDIYIHGSNVSIGCIAIGNNKIKELYYICNLYYKKQNKNIPIQIYPCKMTAPNIKALENSFGKTHPYFSLWKPMVQYYQFFEKNHTLINTTVDEKGVYKFVLPTN